MTTLAERLVERLRRLPAAVVSDVQRNLQTIYAVDPAIRAIVPGVRLAGPAFTVLARSGSIISVHRALLEASAGSVLVVGGETAQSATGALFGKLMAIQAGLRGILGIAVDGPVRDRVELQEMGFPTFARGTTPHVGLNRAVGETQVSVSFGGLVVNPGDYVLGDDDGLAVIQASLAERVIAAAEERLAKESEFITRMQAGEHITDMIGFSELIYGKQ